MIAQLLLRDGTVAFLDDGGVWTHRDDQGREEFLNRNFGPDLYPTSPSEGRPFSTRLLAAARGLRAKYKWLKADKGVKDRVY
jgi:hypothetical protein